MLKNESINPDKLNSLSEKALNYSVGMTISASVYLGDKLGLYKGMMNSIPVSSLELSKRLGLNERWVREWLHGQVTAGFIEYNDQKGTFLLSPEAVKVLADDSNPYFQAGSFSKILALPTILNALEDSFKTGLGFNFDISGQDGAKEVEKTFSAWYRSTFLESVLPSLDKITEKLMSGVKVADIGCGSGIALIEMAKKFPNSIFVGYEISKNALFLAEKNKLAAQASNVTFYNADELPLPEDHSFSLITAFDCLHDMTDPQKMIYSIENSLHKDGTFFLAELNTRNSFLENLLENPFAKHMFSWSLLYCLPSSLAKQGGTGLGACGLSENKLKEFLSKTNLQIYKKHNFNNPLTAYYEIKFDQINI